MGAQVGGGLELICLDQVPRFRIGTCSGGVGWSCSRQEKQT